MMDKRRVGSKDPSTDLVVLLLAFLFVGKVGFVEYLGVKWLYVPAGS